ncbi:LOW QUALITY PROTEIN: A kinase (PRKA) anchor protein 1b [Pristis pectinata]|uniref:LOW QUALITY PROTEIN: A kinase (PRKA) anchor protein 1b n=1 Tax=Pristis pectinata TaxID=685728 RepID=UPI00223D2CED|nr:LOW QUALITY PROTEIN: A kinase (PRKA) anchor protein 1b [Pristis pectinata]
MVLRFRNVFPYTLPGVLALLGWWWYITRKKSHASSYNKQLTAAPEQSTKVEEENRTTVEDGKSELVTGAKECNQKESTAKLQVVPTLQAETLGKPDVAANLFLEASVEKSTQKLVLGSSQSQEALFMPNVQGPIRLSPKAEKDGYLHQMVDKTTIDSLEARQPSVCNVVACSSFSVAKSSDNLEANRKIDQTLPKLTTAVPSTECEQLMSDHHTMERPEPEGENSGNTAEPPCFKAVLNGVSIGPYLVQTGFRQEPEQGSQFHKEACFTDDSLSTESIDKRVNRDEIEEAAADLISEVIMAAKEELFSSRLDPCAEGECTTGAENKLADSTLGMAVLPVAGDAQKECAEIREVNEEKCTVYEAEVTPKSIIPKERAFGLTKEVCKDEEQGHSTEPTISKVCRNSLEEANPVAEDSDCSACHSEDGAGGEYLPQTNVDLCNPEKHESLLSNCQATHVQSELTCKEKFGGPMISNESGMKESVSKDCAKVAPGSMSKVCTEELQLNAVNKKSSEELNVVTEDSGCSVCYSEDGAGGEDLSHSLVESTLENKEKDALHNSVAGGDSLGQDSKPGRKPTLQDDTKLMHTNGGQEAAANGATHLLLEMEFDHSGGSDVNSMDSNDSGCTAGGAEGQSRDGAPPSITKGKTELTIWEVQVPKHLVGRLIGKQGRYVSFLKQTSGAKIYISTLPYTQDFQICHIEGSQQQVDKALNLIGKKFKELDLTNLYAAPPSLTLPALPITSWLMLPDGVTVEVLVVNIVNAGHMFVQQHTHPTCHVLRNMDQQMFLLYSQPGIPTLTPPLEVGIICAAPAVEGAWWRAQVVAFFEETNEVEIRYVDYGGYERVKIEVLRQIRSDFVSLPFQGTEVLLDNIMPLPGEDHFSEEANAMMDEMTRGAALLAQVTGYDNSGMPLIHLWSLAGDEVLFLNRILVEKGHAQWMENY